MIGAVFRLDCSGISGLIMVRRREVRSRTELIMGRRREVRSRSELVMAPSQLVMTIYKF